MKTPWISIWIHPRRTIHTLVSTRPGYGVFFLAALFALQSFFLHAGWWSLDLKLHPSHLLAFGLLLSPAAGFIWLYTASLAFYLISSLLGGKAPLLHLKTVVAWSKVPAIIGAILSFILLIIVPDCNPYLKLIPILPLSLWSLVILIQGIREVEHFSLLRAVSTVLISWGFAASAILLVRYFILMY